MEDESSDNEALKVFCCKISSRKQWIWLNTVVPSILSCSLYIISFLADLVVAYRFIWTHRMPETGLAIFFLIYVPVVFIIILKPPKLPKVLSCTSVVVWVLKTVAYATALPLIISKRLLNRVVWTVNVIHNKKPNEEVVHEYPAVLAKDVHTYLFLQAFLHSCPQAVLQMHLLLLQVTPNKYTECVQVLSLMTAVFSVTMCVASFHRYEAQVLGGRPAVLLLTPPEIISPESSLSLLPTHACVVPEVCSLAADNSTGKVVSFLSWFFLIHSRILCLLISYEIYPLTTLITVIVHFVLMLLYLVVSQPTTFYNMPTKLLNAAISNFSLVEVSVWFHKVTLLYVLFFISIVAEDSVLTVLFFIYSSDICSIAVISCEHFGMYAYIIMNSHVIGVILFMIYLSRYAPVSKLVSANTSVPRDTSK